MRTLAIGMLIVVSCGVLRSEALYACEKCSPTDTSNVSSGTAPKPAGCSLSAAEFSDRSSAIGALFARHEAVRELDDGYAFRFPGDDAELALHLATLVVAERQCCSFFHFELSFAAGQGPIWLSVRGSAEVKALVASLALAGPNTR